MQLFLPTIIISSFSAYLAGNISLYGDNKGLPCLNEMVPDKVTGTWTSVIQPRIGNFQCQRDP